MADSIEIQIKELADLSLVQQRFVSDVSHELRTPLTTIRLAADMINDRREEFDPATARLYDGKRSPIWYRGYFNGELDTAAIRAGASRAEMLETLSMAIYMGAGPSMIYASEALRAFDELSPAADASSLPRPPDHGEVTAPRCGRAGGRSRPPATETVGHDELGTPGIRLLCCRRART